MRAGRSFTKAKPRPRMAQRRQSIWQSRYFGYQNHVSLDRRFAHPPMGGHRCGCL